MSTSQKSMSFDELCMWLQAHGVFLPVQDTGTGVSGEMWLSHENITIPTRVFESMSLNNVRYLGSVLSTSEARSGLN